MVDPIADHTPVIDPAATPTPEPTPAAKKLEFTQDELDKKFADRQRRGEEAAAKRFQKQIDDLTKQIDEFKGKDLGELEKLQKKLEKANEDLKKVPDLELKLTKMEALLNAGADSAQVSKLLKRVSGTTPEEIESDIAELKEMGWIGKPTPPPEPSKAIGGGSQQPPAKPPELKDRIAALTAQAIDPKTPPMERSRIQRDILALKLQIGGDIQVR
ncbi:phage scaffolding protein [Candidatus Pacearchaeota archaeon]|jgi:exonuclease VII large subunit|nr:phage scaffolding protein [Candidatus Pacearchaeota archaeon]